MFKLSQQPGCCRLNSRPVEEKITATWDISQYLPAWVKINSLASLNVRYTVVHNGGNAGNDYSTHRTDPTASSWVADLGGMTPNTTFATAFDNPDLLNDGSPYGRRNKSTNLQTGVGTQFDITMFNKLNLLVGGRIDGSEAENTDEAIGFNNNTGTSANPGRFYTTADTAKDWDDGVSYSASLSYELPYKIRPYVTYANASVALDGNNNTFSNNVLRGPEGHIGRAYLQEAGIKASAFGNRLFFSTAVYDQTRTNVSDIDPNDPSLGVDASSTETRGWEMEIKVVPFRNASASFYALSQRTEFKPNNGGSILVDARTLGFQDIVDANGNVIYPAEAFLYGGRSRVVLPSGMDEYNTKQGNPPRQMGLNLDYMTDSGYGVTLSGNFFSRTYSGRLKLVELPEAYVFNLGVYRNVGPWEIKADVNNMFNRRWFRARTGDSLGDALAQVMPDRKLQFTARMKF